MAVSLLAVATFALIGAVPASAAGRSSTGELAFYPCDRCHPLTVAADGTITPPPPIEIERHTVTLEVHDVLGTGSAACLACHDDPSRNPGKLLLPDGSLVDITGDVSRVCQTCHFPQYREWQTGVHGRGEPKCTASGCHDPHTPSWIYMPALPPFLGTGVEMRAVAEREPFLPLAGPPVPPAVDTPLWLVIVTALGAIVSAGTLGLVIFGRSKR